MRCKARCFLALAVQQCQTMVCLQVQTKSALLLMEELPLSQTYPGKLVIKNVTVNGVPFHLLKRGNGFGQEGHLNCRFSVWLTKDVIWHFPPS